MLRTKEVKQSEWISRSFRDFWFAAFDHSCSLNLPMNPSIPHYLLFSEPRGGPQGVWQFVLRTADGSDRLEASDEEPGLQGERLELLTVVRGLEALDQPSKVTLITPSKYVREGIRYGLSEWRSNGWRWEFYGEMVPVKNRDLWQRVDRAMRFHEVDCRTWRFDRSHGAPVEGRSRSLPEAAVVEGPQREEERGGDAPWPGGIRRWARQMSASLRQLAACCLRRREGMATDRRFR